MPSLKLSCVPMIYFEDLAVTRRMTQFDWIAIANDLGLAAIEIQHRCLESYDPAYLDAIRTELDRRSMTVCQLTGSGDFVNPDPAAREREVELLLRQIEAARRLDAASVRITAGQQHPGLALEQAIANFRACMEACFPAAERAGVHLAYENHYKDYFWQYPDYSFRTEDYLAIHNAMRDTPLKVNFDAANQIMAGEDPLRVLEVVKDRVVHMHANDRKTMGQYQHSIVGEGVTPLRQIFQSLQEAGFSGWVSLEYNGTEGLEGTRKSIEAIRRIWREAQSAAGLAK